jgi:hypothetical protein
MSVLLDRHPALAAFSDELDRSGTWQLWSEADPRLAGLPSFGAAREVYPARARSGSCDASRARFVVAALVERGSARGGDDDEAAMAVVVLLDAGVDALAHQLRDLCDVDDVVDTLWERVKAATPDQGPCAAAFLLKRTREELVRLHGRGRTVGGMDIVPVSQWDQVLVAGDHLPHQHEQEEATGMLGEFIRWACDEGLVRVEDVALVLELIVTEHSASAALDPAAASARRQYGAAQRDVAQRRGITQRTLRRRRNHVVDRLRQARADYLACMSDPDAAPRTHSLQAAFR